MVFIDFGLVILILETMMLCKDGQELEALKGSEAPITAMGIFQINS